MKTGICYLCKKENIFLTKEHIFPQCLGGKLKAEIYCQECNSKTGEKIDIELANVFGMYATLMDIKRERGKNQPFLIKDEISGLELEYDENHFRRQHPDVGTPTFDAIGKFISLECNARAKEELKNIIKGLAKKHGFNENNFDYQELEWQEPSSVMDLTLGNYKIYRAIAKIAYSFACTKLPMEMVLSKSFDGIREYILGQNSIRVVSLNYENTDFMTDNQNPLNKIHLNFNQPEGIIIGYVSIFGAFRYTILVAERMYLSLAYPPIDYDYTSNPITGERFEQSIIAPIINKHEVINPINSEEHVLKSMKIIVKNSSGRLRDIEIAQSEKPSKKDHFMLLKQPFVSTIKN